MAELARGVGQAASDARGGELPEAVDAVALVAEAAQDPSPEGLVLLLGNEVGPRTLVAAEQGTRWT
ncbi:MAG TPA: hypothetical protein VGV57_11735 [Thermoleophilaceae bacterium]|nr:hypothetical protein [Thermoleophilaceae bacterium]